MGKIQVPGLRINGREKRYLLQGCRRNVCISAFEPRAEGPGMQQEVTEVLIRRRIEDKYLRVKREECMPSPLRKWKLLMEEDKEKRLRLVAS